MRIVATQLREDGSRFKGLLEDWPDPGEPQGNQIKTKTLYSGVTNGTERNDLLGGNYCKPDETLPQPWGYQNVGQVVAVGPDVTSVAVGDVLYSSADHTEYALFDEQFLYCKLPAGVDPKEAALFGMTSVAMRTCRNADIGMGDRVLVVGAGIIGQTAAQIANVMGGRVTICDVNEERLELARNIGAAERAVSADEEAWPQNVPDFGFEAVLDFAGVAGMEDKLIAAAAPRGRVMLIAGRQEVRYSFNTGQGHEVTIKQNSHFDNSDLANLCRLVAKGQVRIGPYLRDVVSVEEAKSVYDTLRDNPARLLGTVFVWQ